MACMTVTLDTSHLKMSPLNDDAPSNMLFMSVTSDTSQDPIGPRKPVAQSVDSLRQSAMASLSSFSDPAVVVVVVTVVVVA